MNHLSHKGISSLYDRIYLYYEPINLILTLGFSYYWRKKASSFLKKQTPENIKILDLCCGPGNFSDVLFKKYAGKAKIYGIDLNENMLIEAKKKNPNITYINSDVANLPFENESFDALVISFATRNISVNKEEFISILNEFKRVLKKGGIFLNLETTIPENKLIKFLMFSYVKLMIGTLNMLKPGMKSSYSFLLNTIINFYNADEFADILNRAGFKEIKYKILFPGAVAIHIAKKI